MGGAGDVKGISVFFLVLLVYLGVDSETCFLGMPFQLAALCLELVELIRVPGG